MEPRLRIRCTSPSANFDSSQHDIAVQTVKNHAKMDLLFIRCQSVLIYARKFVSQGTLVSRASIYGLLNTLVSGEATWGQAVIKPAVVGKTL